MGTVVLTSPRTRRKLLFPFLFHGNVSLPSFLMFKCKFEEQCCSLTENIRRVVSFKKIFFFFLFSFIFNTCIEMVVLLLFFIAFIRNICSTELSKLMYYPCIEQDIDLCYARKAGGNLVERPICYSIAQPKSYIAKPIVIIALR